MNTAPKITLEKLQCAMWKVARKKVIDAGETAVILLEQV